MLPATLYQRMFLFQGFFLNLQIYVALFHLTSWYWRNYAHDQTNKQDIFAIVSLHHLPRY